MVKSDKKFVKIVAIGSPACGKTSVLSVISKGQFPDVYVPTVFENYVANIKVYGKQVEFEASVNLIYEI